MRYHVNPSTTKSCPFCGPNFFLGTITEMDNIGEMTPNIRVLVGNTTTDPYNTYVCINCGFEAKFYKDIDSLEVQNPSS